MNSRTYGRMGMNPQGCADKFALAHHITYPITITGGDNRFSFRLYYNQGFEQYMMFRNIFHSWVLEAGWKPIPTNND